MATSSANCDVALLPVDAIYEALAFISYAGPEWTYVAESRGCEPSQSDAVGFVDWQIRICQRMGLVQPSQEADACFIVEDLGSLQS